MATPAPTPGDKAAGGILAALLVGVLILLAVRFRMDMLLAGLHALLAVGCIAGALGMLKGRKWGHIVVACWALLDSSLMLTGQQMGRSLIELDLAISVLNLFGFYALLRLFGIFGEKPN